MSLKFVETGQTFTQDGAAFCPVERKKRGAVAIAASIGVMLAGAGFLTYAMFSDPSPAEIQSAKAQLVESQIAAVDPASEEEAGEIKGEVTAVSTLGSSPTATQTVAIEAAPQSNFETETKALSVDEVLAESRAARAGITATQGEAQQDGLAPRLNPRRAKVALAKTEQSAATADSAVDKTLSPRIKPVTEVKAISKVTAKARPAKAAGSVLAQAVDAPPPFFFASDIERIENYDGPAPVLYARDLDRSFNEVRVKIKRGENFVDALKRAGVGARDRNEAAYAFGKHYNLRRLRPGQEFFLTLGAQNQTLFQLASNKIEPQARLIGLDFRADAENRIHVRRVKTGALAADKETIEMTTRLLSIAGRIDGSLYLSAKAAGAPDQIIADLADAFSYDVDFQREIFGGDEFEAIFEARYDDQGELVSTGDILFARLKWRGRSKEKGYYLFASRQDGDRPDFYDARGKGAKRLLMKTPIDGARLSSRFGTRKHPILGYRRAHKGVDFAANRGTPIKAAGDGVIERSDRYGSFGNYVRIRHANGYKTAYAHLKGFARGIRKGKRVRQGDIIGYVGTTGRSTGPHLHYEVHLNGKAVNPQKLKIATGKSLKADDLERFMVQRDMIDAMRLPLEETTSVFAKDGVVSGSAL
ncbi:MAG: hypothetical protein DHS20C05_16610 [Hyphococcus sp.]|nr:MAG: hypothetical protein DHS20C05_16610 [Marinicaulis sp.]